MMNLPIKNYLIVGSYALNVRPAKDIDVICYEKDVECEYERRDDYSGNFMYQGRRIELLFADKQESLSTFLEKGFKWSDNTAHFTILYALKAGHITRPHKSWDKHIIDYHILRNLVSAYMEGELDNPTLLEGIELHKKSTKERLGVQRLPKLIGVTKEKFFDDLVNKYVEHDTIHEWMAHKERPMYSYMQENPELVECSKSLWGNFSLEDKLKCVLEECYVIARERHIIPTMKGASIGLSYAEAFKWALMRVCTTLCSGWFRQFAIDNYFTLLNSYDKEYYKLLKL